jgi:tetratricopeptide (TPR) repeat protein
MKTYFKTLFVALMVTFSMTSFAQSDKFQSAMKKALSAMDTSKTADQFIAVSNQFERIAAVETKQWLPSYYAAYANLIAGMQAKSSEAKDQLFAKALQQLDKADAISPDNSEIWAVRGYVQFMTMSVNPMSRMDMMRKGNESLEKAKKLNPENPRPWFVHGQNTFYTPEAFGGGKTAAKPLLTAAVAKFDKEKAEGINPNWGKGRAGMLLEQCQ